jgi:cytochrome P450
LEKNVTDPFLLMLNEDNPMPRLHELRASDPVHFVDPLGFWFITRHDDIQRLMYCPEDVTHIRHHWEFYALPPEGSLRRWVEEKHIFTLGPQEHARVRRLVGLAFSPRAVLRMERQIHEVISRMAEPLRGREGGVIDVLGEFTNIVPNAVVSRLTGVQPGADEARFCRIAQAMIEGFGLLAPEHVQLAAEEALQEFFTWMRTLVRKRRDQPGEDLVTDLLRAQDADEAMSEDDIVLLLMALISAGSEATALVSSMVVRALLGMPDVWLRLQNDRSLIQKSIDEILRYSFKMPAGTMRFAVRDFELRGKQIKKGQMLMLSGAGGNFDPEVFERPDALNLGSNAINTTTFGRGPHHCVGANLARKEISTMIDLLLDILPPGSSVCEDLIEYENMGIFRKQKNLPVRVAPRSLA